MNSGKLLLLKRRKVVYASFNNICGCFWCLFFLVVNNSWSKLSSAYSEPVGFRVSKSWNFRFSNSETFRQKDIGNWKDNMLYRKHQALWRKRSFGSRQNTSIHSILEYFIITLPLSSYVNMESHGTSLNFSFLIYKVGHNTQVLWQIRGNIIKHNMECWYQHVPLIVIIIIRRWRTSRSYFLKINGAPVHHIF